MLLVVEYKKKLPVVAVFKFLVGFCMCGVPMNHDVPVEVKEQLPGVGFLFHYGIQGLTQALRLTWQALLSAGPSHLSVLLSETKSTVQPNRPGTHCIGQAGSRFVGDFLASAPPNAVK